MSTTWSHFLLHISCIDIELFPYNTPQQMAVRLMTLAMIKALKQAYKPGLLNMLKFCNIFNIIGDENI